ncbi:MAG: GspH/FimT family pseudopilin [Gammaproteobacteria bacterium]|nr:GspH/FimT family pseudopilin [Gammaproteobacteria bacterium]MBT8064713.1 GspH/FimT family pseudopilin [Gammaproteobacteria bacterium]NNK33531.1 hypothetical protein [Xanthomonadales bacterium]
MNQQKLTVTRRQGMRLACRGVTAIELIITVSILALTLALGVPGYNTMLHKNRISATSNQLHTTLQVARIEAVKRRRAVRVCPSADSSSCRDDGDWSDGWLIYEDQNSNNAPEAAEIIRLVGDIESGVAIEVSAAIEDYLQFQPTGIAVGSGGLNGEFRICHAESNSYSQVLGVSAAGQVNLKQRTQTDCSAAG